MRIDQAAVPAFDLVHATVNSAAESMAVPELSVEPDPEFIISGPVLGASKPDKKRRRE